MQVSEAVEEFRYHTSDLARKTKEYYAEKLTRFQDWCGREGVELEQLREKHIMQFMEEMRKLPGKKYATLSDNTLHGYVQTIKTFLMWAKREYDIPRFREWVPDLKLPKVSAEVIEIFTDDHVRRLLEATKKEFTDTLQVRDVAMIRVMMETGIRAQEVCALTLDRVFLQPDDAYIRVYSEKVKRDREIPLGKVARTALYRYITRYRKVPNTEQHVFLSRFNEPFTSNGIFQLFARLGEWARISDVRCSPHTCRHSFAVNFMKNGGDLYKLSKLLGHSNVTVTQRFYLRAFPQREARQGAPSWMDRMK